jgi:hypothetical protein
MAEPVTDPEVGAGAEPARAPRVGRAVAFLVVLGLLVAAMVVDRTAADESRAQPLAPVGVAVPASDAAVSTWYCAEGTSAAGGRADEVVYLSNLDDRVAHARVTVMAGEQGGTKVVPLDVPGRSVVPVRVSDVLPAAEPGVLVEASGARVVVTHGLTGNGDVAIGPCASSPSPRWHFAAANTGRGSLVWLALFNPTADDAIVDVSFVTDGGPVAPESLHGVVVPRASRVSIPVHEAAARRVLVGTVVAARRGQVVAEQSMTLDGTDGRKGLAVSLGAPELARRWELPTGLVGPGRAQQVVIANPGENPVDATVQIELDAAAELAPQRVTVAPGTALNVDLGLVPTGVGFSTAVRASEPVVVETLASTTTPNAPAVRGIASAVGQPAAARSWALAPARASERSVDFVDVVNAGPRTVAFTVTVLSDGDRRVLDDLPADRVGVGQRAVLDLRALGVPANAVLVVRGDGPLVVDREASAVPGLTLAGAIPDLHRG